MEDEVRCLNPGEKLLEEGLNSFIFGASIVSDKSVL
jgi:hypothetical protein